MIDAHGNAMNNVSCCGEVTGTLEDTNGNAVNGTGRSGTYQSFQPWGDALGNPKTASRTFAGGATYNYTWGTATTSFIPFSVDETVIQIGYDNLCVHSGSFNFGFLQNNTNPVVVKMQEPDGLYYTFSYDSNYGLLNQIMYPTGAWVQYTWGVNSLSDATGFTTPAQFVNSYNDPIHLTSGQSMNTSCVFQHDTPAIVKRVVSYDGVHPAMEQDFSYSTVWQTGYNGQFWTSKQTIVTTKDLISPGTPSFKTTYNYSPYIPYYAIGNHLLSSPIPIESTIVYQDTAGNVLRTVTKGWNYNNQLAAECTTLPNGKTTGTFYQYQSYPLAGNDPSAMNPAGLTTDLHTDVAEYDYGLITTPCLRPSTTPTRETVTTYANFANTPLWPTFSQNGTRQISMPPMVDRPATVVTYQNGTKIAETDYAYDQTAVASVSPTPLGHDETNYGNGSTVPRGNVTTVTRKCFQGSITCTNSVTTIAYDTTGQPVSVTDANNNQTKLSYTDNYTTDDGSPSGNTNTEVTTIQRPTTNGVAHIETFQWDFNKGELRVLTDENSQPTTYQYLDPWWRLTKSTFPDGGSITKTYQDAGPNPTVTTNAAINNSLSLTSTTIMDAAGHVIHTQLNSDTDGVDYVDTVYDGLGRVASVTNPYRSTSDPTYGVTTFSYDSLNRKTIQVQPDGSKLQWCFNNIASSGQTNCSANVSSQASSEWTDSSDEAGNHWQRTYDALDRLTSVLEPNGSSQAPSMETDYAYDALNNLTGVVQNGSRQRSFAYDSLSRLTSAANPESGTTTYGYDANGNLTGKTDARSISTSFSYDALNRLTAKTYSGGTPSASYTYDASSIDGFTISNPIGRLVKEATGDGQTATWNSYDLMGRTANQWQCSPLNCGATPYSKTFAYDFLGDHTSETYSYTTGTLTISYGYNGVARPTQITSNYVDSQHPATLASGITYNAAAAVTKLTYGNGLTETRVYNNRLQPCRLNVNSAGTNLNSCTDALPSGNVQDFSYGLNAGTSDNGNVASWSATGQQTFGRTYTYDTLNRVAALSSPSDPTGCTGLSWTYDAWGNRTAQTVTGGSCNQQPSTTFSANNQLPPPYQYDAAGNMTYDGLHNYAYDAENRLTQVDSGSTASYIYDAEGRRARKTLGTNTTDYLYDLSGNIFSTFGPGCQAGCWTAGAVYLNGRFFAQYYNQTTYFVHADHLGSTRVLTGMDQSVCDSLDYLPFGEQIAGGSCTDLKFTGKERDGESGLDNFGARYDSSSLGRFMSPDNPKFSEKTDPQTWNLYSYVSNNPLARIDPTGHNWFNFNGSWQWYSGANVTNAGKSCKQGSNGCHHSDYTHLLVIQKLSDKTGQGATRVTLTLYNQNQIIARGTGFTGGLDTPVPSGNYEINLNNRGGIDTNVSVAMGGGRYVLKAFHDGIQEVGDAVPAGGGTINWQEEWGHLRANLSPGPGGGTPYYLHGKGLYFTEGQTSTNGCVCEPSESVLGKIFSLDPSGVGEGAKTGRIAASVNKPN